MTNAQGLASAQQRVIRVFVSSTFRDMQAEREVLVKHTFPQLRKLCQRRSVTWGEVDLRWGITDEQKAEGKVLPICLEEIHRCRPYFLGILGERYGWVPEHVPQELIEREEWLRKHPMKSVTELEILHGVLRNPDMASHGFFYFRDPRYLDSLPPNIRQEFRSHHAASIEKLHALKQQIRDSHFPVRENYASPKVLGRLVLRDLTDVIESRFPIVSVPSALEQEALEHAAFARSRSNVYIGRKSYFDLLDGHAKGDTPPLVVLGESGSGKSALLANWALQHREAHPEDFIILHFIGGSPASSSWASMLRRIMGELKNQFDIREDVPDNLDGLRLTFANWLNMAGKQMSNRNPKVKYQLKKAESWARRIAGVPERLPLPSRLVIILDALNQLEDREGALDLVWLPLAIPPRIRLIVSTLQGRPLDELRIRSWPTLTIQPLESEERQQFITSYLKQYRKELESAQLRRIADREATSNPLYLRSLLEELRQLGSHEELDTRINNYLEGKNPIELYRGILRRWEEDYGKDLVRGSMSLLWAARRGLSEIELMECLGTEAKPMIRADWSPLFLASAESLVSRGGLLTFFHDYLRQAVHDTYLRNPDAERGTHRRLANYFEGSHHSARRVDELPWQLEHAGDWTRLYELLSREQFFKAAWAMDPFEIKSHWARLEAESAFRMSDAYRIVSHNPGRFDPNYVWSLAILLSDSGHVLMALHLAKYLLQSTDVKMDRNALATAMGCVAVGLQLSGDLDQAMKLHEAEEAIFRQLKEKKGLQRSLGNQGLIFQARGQFEHAMRRHKEEGALCLELLDQEGLQRSLGNQALILQATGDLQGAFDLHRQQEHICLGLGHQLGLANSYSGQGIILKARSELSEAMQLHKRAAEIYYNLGNRHGVAVSLGNQAILMRELGQPDEGLKLHEKEERLRRDLRDPAGLAVSLGNQALIYCDRGDYKQALLLHQHEERICRELKHSEGVANSRLNQGAVFQKQGQLDRALALYRKAERTFMELHIVDGWANSLLNQAWVQGLERNEVSAALILADKALNLASQGGYTVLVSQIEDIRTKIRGKQAV